MNQINSAIATKTTPHYAPWKTTQQPVSESNAALVAVSRRSRILKPGEQVFDVGDAFHTLYLVRSGSIKVYAISDDGDEQVIGFYFPGDLVGLDALDARYHGCVAVTLETSSVYELSVDRLEQRCQTDPDLQQQVNRLYSRELARERQLLRLLGKKNASQRLAGFLLNLSQRFELLGLSASKFNLSMSRHDIAHYTGLAVETVSRLLGRFQDEGLLVVERRYIHILDKQRLQRLV